MAVKAKAEITISKISDIVSVTRYYLSQSSTAAAPAKPTTNPPGGNWTTTEPTYTSGSTNTLYFVDLTVYSNKLPDTNVNFSYSAVSKSSSYEAAKQAYNKADAASQRLASWCDENDQTLIDGSKIYTGSVGAKQINVTDLFAQDITASGTITGSTLKGSSAELTSGKIGPFALDPAGLTSTLSTNMVFNSRDVWWASYELKRFEENDSIVFFARSLSMSYIDSCSFTADIYTLTSDLPNYRAIDVDGNIVSNITALRLVPVFLAGGNIYYADGFSSLDINNAKASAKSSGAATFGLGLQVRVAGTTSSGAAVNPIIKIKWAAQSQQVYRNRAFTDDLLSTFNPKATITVSSVDVSMTVDGFKYGVFEVSGGYAHVRGGSLRVSNHIEATNTHMSNSDMEYLDSSARGIFAYKYVNGSSGFSCPALYTYPAYTQSDNTNRICSYNWLDDPTDYDDPYTECDYTKLPLDIEASALKLNGTNVSVTGHTHDDRYYTETEINNKLKPVSVTLKSTSANVSSGSSATCKYIPALGMCFFRGYLAERSSKTYASGTAYTLWTVSDSAYRPDSRHAFAVESQSTTKIGVRINPDGEIVLIPRGATVNTGNLIYMTGWWFV